MAPHSAPLANPFAALLAGRVLSAVGAQEAKTAGEFGRARAVRRDSLAESRRPRRCRRLFRREARRQNHFTYRSFEGNMSPWPPEASSER